MRKKTSKLSVDQLMTGTQALKKQKEERIKIENEKDYLANMRFVMRMEDLQNPKRTWKKRRKKRK